MEHKDIWGEGVNRNCCLVSHSLTYFAPLRLQGEEVRGEERERARVK